MFLEEQKFSAGDGQLHYYLYNYRAAPIPRGVNTKNQPDEKHMGWCWSYALSESKGGGYLSVRILW